MNSVVITGASGFIGRHLVSYLVQQNIDVYAITRNENSCLAQMPKTPRLHIVVGDYVTDDFYQELPQNPLAVLHLAWSGAHAQERNAPEVQTANLSYCLNAVALAERLHAEKFILPGSTMEYAYCGQAINKNALPTPLNFYGAAKLSARYLCQIACQNRKIPFIYTVISGVYGADRKDGNIISYTIDELLHGRIPKYTKLEQKWDYVHIDDVVRAFLCVIQKGKPDSFYVIGHGDNCPLSDYIYQIRDVIEPGAPLDIGAIPYQNGKLPESCVDLTAIEKDTGFTPSIAFEDGIRAIIAKSREEL